MTLVTPKDHPVAGEVGKPSGMTLRDYFAAHAMFVAMAKAEKGLANYEIDALFGPHRTGIKNEEIAAALAYQLADAMVERRSALSARKTGA